MTKSRRNTEEEQDCIQEQDHERDGHERRDCRRKKARITQFLMTTSAEGCKPLQFFVVLTVNYILKTVG
jgi:hypothetical protein